MERLSLVVPSKDEERWIGRLCDAIERLEEPPNEIIVADGMSRDRTAEIARAHGFIVVSNSSVHAAAGRNLGLRQATGDIIAFTDCDCVPAPDWTARIRRRFCEDPYLVALGGRMSALPPVNDVDRFAGEVFIDQIMRFPSELLRPKDGTVSGAFITANCAYRRKALDELGGFSGWFANHAEDIDLYWRALAKFPGKLLYDPDIVIEHSFPSTVPALWRKYVQYGIASSKLAKRHSNRVQIDWTLYRRLATSCLAVVTRSPHQRDPALQAIQLSAHAAGKAWGSFTSRCINL